LRRAEFRQLGDIIDVRMTTGANLSGPHNAQISAVIANI
jgi:hypothetical protein